MEQMGYESYQYEPVRIKSSNTSLTIAAYNEFYYLVSFSVPASLKIKSDTNILTDVSGYNSWVFFHHKEFSGLIEITQSVPIDLEFIRVIPQIKNNHCNQ